MRLTRGKHTQVMRKFLLTHLMRGATSVIQAVARMNGIFLLTHLMRGATLTGYARAALRHGISTHTPHARCDELFSDFFRLCQISTHTPHARCDQNGNFAPIDLYISTHTPHARCDKIHLIFAIFARRFLLTHLMRGATSAADNPEWDD